MSPTYHSDSEDELKMMLEMGDDERVSERDRISGGKREPDVR